MHRAETCDVTVYNRCKTAVIRRFPRVFGGVSKPRDYDENAVAILRCARVSMGLNLDVPMRKSFGMIIGRTGVDFTLPLK